MRYGEIDRVTTAVLWGHLVALAAHVALAGPLRLSERLVTPFSYRVLGLDEVAVALAAGVVAAGVPLWARRRVANHHVWRLLVAAGLTLFSFLFIFASGGAIEMHFHVFIVMAYLAIYADWRLQWVVLGLVVAHHLALDAVRPHWLFQYGRSVSALVVHALSIFVTAAFLTVVCENRRESIRALVDARRELEADAARRVRAERELQRARAELAGSQRLSSLGTLVSGVAHEIRTPLTYISTNVALVRDRLRRAESGREAPGAAARDVAPLAEAALEGVDRINRLVLDLRRFTRLEPDRRETTGLHEVVPEAVALFQATSRGTVRVEARFDPTPRVPLDRVQVHQVVLNLLHNAAEAGSRVVRVETRAAGAGVDAELVVADDGSGIPEAVQARAFEPLVTTKPDGTGLGLSIVRRIAEAHGGRVAFETAEGKGTTFVVSFAAAPATRPSPANPEPPKH